MAFVGTTFSFAIAFVWSTISMTLNTLLLRHARDRLPSASFVAWSCELVKLIITTVSITATTIILIGRRDAYRQLRRPPKSQRIVIDDTNGAPLEMSSLKRNITSPRLRSNRIAALTQSRAVSDTIHDMNMIVNEEDMNGEHNNIDDEDSTREKCVNWSCVALGFSALLYTVEVNVMIIALRFIDATTMHLVGSTKILFTAILCRIVFKHQLSKMQWTCLALLMIGVAIGNHSLSANNHTMKRRDEDFLYQQETGIILALCMSLSSSLANVWTEFVYKKHCELSIHAHNIQLYGFSTLFNLAWLIYRNDWTNDINVIIVQRGNLNMLIAVVIVSSTTGISIAFMLKFLSNLTLVFAHGSSMLLTLILSIIMLNYKLTPTFACSIMLVAIASIGYHWHDRSSSRSIHSH